MSIESSVAVNHPDQPFAELSPDVVLDAAERLGLECDGRLFALNSYENRVYQVGSLPLGMHVLKFYRPGRWSDAQIIEEHTFTQELAQAELPVAAPLVFDGQTLLWHQGLRYAVFPRMSARAVELDARGSLELIGRTLGRIHAIGARSRFACRPALSIERLGWSARETLLDSALLDDSLLEKYAEVSEALLEAVETALKRIGPLSQIRLHGDCHLGNILWNEQGPVFVDLDDCMSGPRIQDLWMFLSGSPEDRRSQWAELVLGYRQFHEIDDFEKELIEPLRTLRMVHHAAWIAARWGDPAFPRAFPWFSSPRFWQEHLSDLWQQLTEIS
ncbi:MAG: serine/threonine protein kinase [Gammaproteobacteria bacterium]|nr:serine/threonine protein kinase [Gammaproteobacteria bacterium]